MGANKTSRKWFWKSKAFIIVLCIFSVPAIYGLFKGGTAFVFFVGLIVAFIMGLIAWGVASLIPRGRKPSQ